MGERILAVTSAAVFAVLLAFYSQANHAEAKADTQSASKSPPVLWNKVPDSERRVLSALEKDWIQLSGNQQRRLIGAAKKYPKMLPIQQERFQDRLKEWASLTPEQRHAARDKYQNLSSLPPAKQYELREKWQEKAASSKDPAKASPDSPAK